MTVNIIQHATDEADWYDAEGLENATGAASLPLTLLTLDRARRELRVPPGDTGQDPLIREQIEAAVSYCQEDLNIPILQERVYTLLFHTRTECPLKFGGDSDPYVMFASKVRYQLSTVDDYIIGDWPEEVDIDEAHQIAPGVGDGDLIAGNIIVKPPDGKWPDAAGNHYALHYVRGIKSTNRDLGIIRQLVILKLRDLFYGSPYMKGTEANSAYGRLKKTVSFKFPTINFQRID